MEVRSYNEIQTVYSSYSVLSKIVKAPKFTVERIQLEESRKKIRPKPAIKYPTPHCLIQFLYLLLLYPVLI